MASFRQHLQNLCAEFEVLQRENGSLAKQNFDLRQRLHVLTADRNSIACHEPAGFVQDHVIETMALEGGQGCDVRDLDSGLATACGGGPRTSKAVTPKSRPREDFSISAEDMPMFSTDASSTRASPHPYESLRARASKRSSSKAHMSHREEQFHRLAQNGRISAEQCFALIERLDPFPAEETLEHVVETVKYVNILSVKSERSGPSELGVAIADDEVGIGMTFQSFLHLMDEDDIGDESLTDNLRQAFIQETTDHIAEVSRRIVEDRQPRPEPGPQGYVAFLLDTIPAVVIVLNAIAIGLQTDIATDDIFWEVLEILFTLFFGAEFLVKLRVLGMKTYFWGKDYLWNIFDLFCLTTALVDMSITYTVRMLSPGEESANLGIFMLLKILRLARLTRLVRLLRFKVCNELKMIVQGVFSGVRTLFWAIVLLFVVVFLLGIVMRKLVGSEHLEFETLPAAMFTLFRCFTDGCSATDGTPLHENLRVRYGGVFMIFYILIFLFVTIGIFNLIMAIFIDNVVTAHVQRKQTELGESAARMEVNIQESIANLLGRTAECANDGSLLARTTNHIDTFTPEGKAQELATRRESASHMLESLKEGNIQIPRDVFQMWLDDPIMLNMLDEADIETSTKSDLFDVLDVDMGGELGLDELVGGLMRLRGPISKSDIVAIRLKVQYLTQLIEDVWRHCGCDKTSRLFATLAIKKEC